MSQSSRFEQFEIDYANARIDVNGKRIKADSEPTQENTDAAAAALAAQADLCRKFRNWCAQKRDGLARELGGDAPREFSLTERAEWQTLHDEIVKRLSELEADCPTVDDPPIPPPPVVRARRTLL